MAAAVKPKTGRPTKFRPEFVKQAERLANIGATDAEIANFFEINVLTLHRWKHTNSAFCNSLKRGKEPADNAVAERLFAKATGYSYPAVKIFQVDGKPLIVPYTEHVPPDTTAAIFWLKNRRPDQWRDRIEHSGPAGEPIQFIMQNRPAKESSRG